MKEARQGHSQNNGEV